MHYNGIVSHTKHFLYTSHFVKQVFSPQFTDEKTETAWLPKFFGTESRKEVGGLSTLQAAQDPGF